MIGWENKCQRRTALGMRTHNQGNYSIGITVAQMKGSERLTIQTAAKSARNNFGTECELTD